MGEAFLVELGSLDCKLWNVCGEKTTVLFEGVELCTMSAWFLARSLSALWCRFLLKMLAESHSAEY